MQIITFVFYCVRSTLSLTHFNISSVLMSTMLTVASLGFGPKRDIKHGQPGDLDTLPAVTLDGGVDRPVCPVVLMYLTSQPTRMYDVGVDPVG